MGGFKPAPVTKGMKVTLQAQNGDVTTRIVAPSWDPDWFADQAAYEAEVGKAAAIEQWYEDGKVLQYQPTTVEAV